LLTGADAQITDCRIVGNAVGLSGGGIDCYRSDPTITGCIIQANHAGVSGGGIYCEESSPVISDCAITGNSAVDPGGGIYCQESSPTVIGCIIDGNESGNNGGGIYCIDASPTIANCAITGNFAESFGGGISLYSYSSPGIVNCVLKGNVSGYSGGAISSTYYSNPTIMNCTISGNRASVAGGGIYDNYGALTITNCIFWGDSADFTGDELYIPSGTPTVTYCDIQNGTGEYWFGTGCIDEDPLLLPIAGGVLRLGHGSPCIDAGSSDSPAPPTDMEGRPRWDDPNTEPNTGTGSGGSYYDIGAHEFRGYYVLGDGGQDNWDGLTPAWDGLHGPKLTIQAAIDASSTGDVVVVAPGLYTGTGNKALNFANGLTGGQTRNITLASSAGAEATTIDCESTDPGFNFVTGENRSAMVKGFTIRNGFALFDGGGIRCDSSSPTIMECIITENLADDNGGGIACNWGANPKIMNCVITGNTLSGSYLRPFGLGGGVYCSESSPSIESCIISNNESKYEGGGIYLLSSRASVVDCLIESNHCAAPSGGGGISLEYSNALIAYCRILYNSSPVGAGIDCVWSSPDIINCTIGNNTADGEGGGMSCTFSSDPTVTNCVLSHNVAVHGGAIHCNDSDPTFTNCTISTNTATTDGGGLYGVASSTVFTNCILWDDSPNEIGTGATVNYCDIQGGWTGTGNIDVDPMFVCPLNQNYRLMPQSPCVDAGTSTGTPETDMAGRPRHDSPITPNTGGGSLDYFDIGMHEFKGYFVNDETGDDAWNGLYAIYLGDDNGPKKTIQDAINETVLADTVVVAPGTYRGPGNRDLNYSGKDITVLSKEGAEKTIIDAEYAGRGFDFFHFETHMAVLMGFTVANGNALEGACIKCHTDSNPTIIDCIISGGWAGGAPTYGIGGGILTYRSRPTFIDCTVTSCTADYHGGGVGFWEESPAMINCRITNNLCGELGGGLIFVSQDVPDNCNPLLYNCLITGNNAASFGGGIYCLDSDAALINCTLAGNSASVDGGGLTCQASSPAITNSIFWVNNPNPIYVYSGSPTVEYSCVEGGWAGTGNIGGNPGDDPLFVTGPLHSYYLSQVASGQAANSPCVDAGNANAAHLGLEGLTTRTDGGKDLLTVDMGYHAPFLLRITAIYPVGNDIVIEWNARDGEVYTVQWSTDMQTWNDVYVGATNSWTDVGGALESERYYRVVEN
jgi:parallel beta-helix repeat protein